MRNDKATKVQPRGRFVWSHTDRIHASGTRATVRSDANPAFEVTTHESIGTACRLSTVLAWFYVRKVANGHWSIEARKGPCGDWSPAHILTPDAGPRLAATLGDALTFCALLTRAPGDPAPETKPQAPAAPAAEEPVIIPQAIAECSRCQTTAPVVRRNFPPYAGGLVCEPCVRELSADVPAEPEGCTFEVRTSGPIGYSPCGRLATSRNAAGSPRCAEHADKEAAEDRRTDETIARHAAIAAANPVKTELAMPTTCGMLRNVYSQGKLTGEPATCGAPAETHKTAEGLTIGVCEFHADKFLEQTGLDVCGMCGTCARCVRINEMNTPKSPEEAAFRARAQRREDLTEGGYSDAEAAAIVPEPLPPVGLMRGIIPDADCDAVLAHVEAAQVPDKAKRYTVDVSHVDTCLPDYVLDHCNGDDELLVGLSLGTSAEEAADSIAEECGNSDKVPAELSHEAIREAAAATCAHVDLRYIDSDGNPCDEAPEDRDSEEPQAWFRVTWVESDDEPQAAPAPESPATDSPQPQASEAAPVPPVATPPATGGTEPAPVASGGTGSDDGSDDTSPDGNGPTDDEAAEFLAGAWGGMLFTAGAYSDNPNAPAEFGPGDVPSIDSKLSAAQAAELRADCLGFLSSPGVVEAIRATCGEDWRGARCGFETAGTDFHFTRNRHGAGFWDGDWDEPGRCDGPNPHTPPDKFGSAFRYAPDYKPRRFGELLSEAARGFGTCELSTGTEDEPESSELYVDADGKYFFHG